MNCPSLWRQITLQKGSGFNLIRPVNNSYTSNQRPLLEWTSVTDTGVGMGKLQLWLDGVLAVDNIDPATTQLDLSTSSVASLGEGHHTWQIRAFDKLANEGDSVIWSFNIDLSPPQTFTMSLPADGALSLINTPTFCWNAAVDAPLPGGVAGGGIGRYEIWIDNAFNTNVFADHTCSAPGSTLADGTHTVFIKAFDIFNHERDTAPRTITVDTQPPHHFTVVSPPDGALSCISEPTFCWNTTTDDGTGLDHYELTIGGSSIDVAPQSGAQMCHTIGAGLPDASYNWSVTAWDKAGKTQQSDIRSIAMLVDNTPPTLTLDSPAANACEAASGFTVAGTATDAAGSCASGVVFVEVSSDGSTWVAATYSSSNGSWHTPWSAVQSGPITLTARAIDAQGLVTPIGSQPSVTIYGDSTAPTAFSSTGPADNAWVSATPTFAWNATTDIGCGLANYILSIDGQSPITLPSNAVQYTLTAVQSLTQGTTHWRVNAEDKVGLVTSTADRTIRVDTTLPNTPTLTAPICGWTNATTITAAFSATDGYGQVCGYQAFVDGSGPSAVSTTTWNLPALGEGDHTLRINAVDCAGNAGPQSSSCAIRIDRTPPSVPLASLPASGDFVPSSTPTFTWAPSTDGPIADPSLLCGYTVTVDTSSVQVAGNVTTYTPTTALTEGLHSWSVSATDCATNSSGSSAVISFTVDTHSPSAVVFSAPASGGWVNTRQPTITWAAATDVGTGIAGYSIAVDSGSVTALPANQTSYPIPTPLSEGQRCVTVNSIDHAGNTTPSALCFNVDVTLPTTPSGSSPVGGNFVLTGKPALTWTLATDALSQVCSYIVTIDGADHASSGTGTTYTPATALLDGLHHWSVRAVDCAGNQGTASTSAAFSVDTTPPAAVTLGAPASGTWVTNAEPTMQWTASSDTGSGLCQYVVTLDGTDITLNSNSVTTYTPSTSLSQGAHHWTVSAVDCSGNRSTAPTSATFSVDTIAPTAVTVTSPSSNEWLNTGSPTVTWSASQDSGGSGVANYLVTVGTNAAVPVTATQFTPTASLAEGDYCVSVQAVDIAGNKGVSLSVCFRIDLTNPSVPTLQAPAAGGFVGHTEPTFTWAAATDADSGICGYVLSIDDTPHALASNATNGTFPVVLIGGVHTWTVAAVDCAGNTGDAASKLSFNVDLTPPTAVVFDSPANNAWLKTSTPTITWTASQDTGSGLTGYVLTLGTSTLSLPATSSSYTFPTALAEGQTTIALHAMDNVGNATADTSLSFGVDLTPPTAANLTSPAAHSCIGATQPTLTWTAPTDALSGIGGLTLVVDSQSTPLSPVSVTSATPPSVLQSGDHAWQIHAFDRAGNETDSTASAFTIDTTPPQCAITALEAQSGAGLQIVGTASDVGCGGLAGVEVRIDSGDWQAATLVNDSNGNNWSFGWTPVGTGTVSLSCRATDGVGLNAQGQAASATIGACFAPSTCNAGHCTTPTTGTSCDDGNPNTVGDVCTAGVCAGVDHCIGVVCAAQDQCHEVGTCIDHATGACSNPVSNGTTCDDSNPNTAGDVCTAGVCSGVDHCVGVVCAAPDQCHEAGACIDHATGACSTPAKADGTACSTGLCQAGACTPATASAGGCQSAGDVSTAALLTLLLYWHVVRQKRKRAECTRAMKSQSI